ncbi:uncharacterized protein LOC144639172 isoform X2 [Oculina patagonica]
MAEKLCSSNRMALIVLEDCEEKKFIETIKSPKACNEHTPIVFISSGPLSDIVRHLMQEQYIDELVFKCLTLECDLGSAVNRLITQPGQFAVTPKSKRPGIVRKRKLDTGRNKEPSDTVASPTDWQSAPSTEGLRLIPPLLHGCDYSQSSYHMNQFMMPMPPFQRQGCYEHKSDLPAEQMPYGGISYSCNHNAQLQPCPELNFHSDSGKSDVQAKKEDSVQQCIVSKYAQISEGDQCRPSVIVKTDKEQSVNSDPKDKDKTEETNNSGDSKDKNIQSAERTKVSKARVDKSTPKKSVNVQTASPNSAKKGHTSGQSRTKRKNTGSTSLERKVQHLDKEKKRRERITKSWHWLRQLVPNCDTYADKATVFEMSVAYLHHCWKYHGPLLKQINKDFASLNQTTIPPEDMEDNVTEVLKKESKAFGNTRQQ